MPIAPRPRTYRRRRDRDPRGDWIIKFSAVQARPEQPFSLGGHVYLTRANPRRLIYTIAAMRCSSSTGGTALSSAAGETRSSAKTGAAAARILI